MSPPIIIRHAHASDATAIASLLGVYSPKGLLLARDKEDVLQHINNFYVALCDSKVVGCVALRDFGNALYEVRSLAVDEHFGGRGIGSKLVDYLLHHLPKDEKIRLFALTYRVDFFLRLGFKEVQKEIFPEKIWHDCRKCPKFDNCDEFAVAMTV